MAIRYVHSRPGWASKSQSAIIIVKENDYKLESPMINHCEEEEDDGVEVPIWIKGLRRDTPWSPSKRDV